MSTRISALSAKGLDEACAAKAVRLACNQFGSLLPISTDVGREAVRFARGDIDALSRLVRSMRSPAGIVRVRPWLEVKYYGVAIVTPGGTTIYVEGNGGDDTVAVSVGFGQMGSQQRATRIRRIWAGFAINFEIH